MRARCASDCVEAIGVNVEIMIHRRVWACMGEFKSKSCEEWVAV